MSFENNIEKGELHMKKMVKLVAVSAAAMTFGITGSNVNACPISQTYRQNLQNAQNKMDQISQLDTNSSKDGVSGNWDLTQEKDILNKSVNTILEPSFANTDNKPQDTLLNTVVFVSDKKDDSDTLSDSYEQSDQSQNATALYDAEQDVINAIFANTNEGGNAQSDAQNVNKQNANNNNTNAQNSSSSKKADVAVNAGNNNAKKDNAANKQSTNNEANAQQNTAKSNANVEGTKTVANEDESGSSKNQGNGAMAEAQNENTTAAGETKTVAKTQAKSANNAASQKNNTSVFPQTGEQASEILAIAGGLVIAATAAGIVVYKKRN